MNKLSYFYSRYINIIFHFSNHCLRNVHSSLLSQNIQPSFPPAPQKAQQQKAAPAGIIRHHTAPNRLQPSMKDVNAHQRPCDAHAPHRAGRNHKARPCIADAVAYALHYDRYGEQRLGHGNDAQYRGAQGHHLPVPGKDPH